MDKEEAKLKKRNAQNFAKSAVKPRQLLELQKESATGSVLIPASLYPGTLFAEEALLLTTEFLQLSLAFMRRS